MLYLRVSNIELRCLWVRASPQDIGPFLKGNPTIHHLINKFTMLAARSYMAVHACDFRPKNIETERVTPAKYYARYICRCSLF